MEAALKDDVFTKGSSHAFLSREESYSDAMRKAVHYLQKAKELNLDAEDRETYSMFVFLILGCFFNI